MTTSTDPRPLPSLSPYPAGSRLEQRWLVYGEAYAAATAAHHQEHHGNPEPSVFCGMRANGDCGEYGECGCPPIEGGTR